MSSQGGRVENHHFHTRPAENGAGVFKYPIVPLRAASSDGHMMRLDKEYIWASITASGKGQTGGDWGTTHLIPNQVNVSNLISGTDGHTPLSSS